MLKRRRRSDQDELLVRQEAPPVAIPRPPEKPKRALRPPAQPPLPAGTTPAMQRAGGPPAPPLPEAPPPTGEAPGVADAPPRIYHRKRRRGVFLIVRQLAVVAILLAGGYVGLPFVLRADRFRASVEETLGARLGRKVRIGGLKFTPGLGGLIASDVAIAEDPGFGGGPFARAPQVQFGVHRLDLLFRGDAEVTSIDVSQPRITLIRNAAGRWNFSTILTGGAAPQAAGPALRIRDGILTLLSGSAEPFTLRSLSADFPRLSSAAESGFGISASVEGGGTLKLNGKAGPVIYNPGAPALPMSVLVNARNVALNRSTLTERLAPALDGQLTFDGTVESDGSVVTVNGNASIARLKLARQATAAGEPVLFVFTVRHNLASGSGEIQRGEIHLGNGTADLKGGYFEASGRTMLKAALQARGIPPKRIAQLLGAAAIPLPSGATLEGGIGFAELAFDGPTDSPTTAGTVRLDNARLTPFELAERLSSIAGLDTLRLPRDLAIDSLASQVHAGPERVVLDEIEMSLPGVGAVTGRGFISNGRTLELQMEAVRRADRRRIPFIVRGSCSAPVFRPPGKM